MGLVKEAAGATEEKAPLWTRDFIFLALSNLILFAGFQMLMPTLPKYVGFLGGAESVVGLTTGIFTISAVLVRPWVGLELDRRGRRGIYLIGLAVFVISVLLYSLAPSILALLIFRLLHGFGWGASTTSAGTIVADILPPQRRAEGMGYYGLSANLAMAVAPTLGLYLADTFNFRVVFFASAALALLATFTASRIHIPSLVKHQEELRPALFEPRAFRPSLVAFFMTLTYGGVVTFLPGYADSLGIAHAGLFFSVYAVTLMVIRPVAGIVADRRGPDIVLIPGLILITVTMVLMSASKNMAMLLAVAFLYGLAFGSAHPTLQAMTVDGVAPNRRGAANSTFFSAFDLGIGVGASVLGVISQFAGYRMMYLAAAGFSLAGLLFYLLSNRRSRST
ncbi:MAG: hypothetical protein PWP65_1508 [Clostridia bacterium]|nr:hypothetical protein [Clostridia bacterium]